MQLKAKAYAKVNTVLAINGKTDNGYHLLDTVMQSVGLFDTVTVTKGKSGITVSCGELSDGQNICSTVATRFLEKIGSSDGVHIAVEKNIPLAAGLGGGSADAAATLMLLNQLYDYPFSMETLSSLALTLGADIPFCLTGGTARAYGVGEKLVPLNNRLSYALVLIKNGKKLSTGAIYAAYDHSKAACQPVPSALEAAIKKSDYSSFCRNVGNAFASLWQQDELTARLKALGADAVCLTGSGPTVFGVFKTEKQAVAAAAELAKQYRQVYTALPVPYGIEIV